MVQNVETQASVSGQSLVGRRVYSPAALAAYTVLSSLPVGLVLYGLNLKARGQRRLGFWMELASAIDAEMKRFAKERGL